jgi:hypothetical protein
VADLPSGKFTQTTDVDRVGAQHFVRGVEKKAFRPGHFILSRYKYRFTGGLSFTQ